MHQTLPYRSLYVYPWDILDCGVTEFVDEMLAMGITDISVATSYHAGKFIRPHAKNPPCVIFPEDGVVYFNPQIESYGEIKPQAHSDPKLREVLPALFADGRLRIHAWTVLMHNSRIGQAYPHRLTRNAFGDPYLYSLCPMHEANVDYARALCTDLSGQFPFDSLILETPGWLPYGHGFHHEFAQITLTPWLDQMLGLCFCDACQTAAKKNGIAIDELQEKIKHDIRHALQHGSPSEQARQTLQADGANNEALAALIRLRQARVTQIVKTLRAEINPSTQLAIIPTVQRPSRICWTEGSDLKALSEVADYLEIPFYEASAERAILDAQECLAQEIPAHKIRGILRPGLPDLRAGQEFPAAFKELNALGIQDLGFYNYGLLPSSQLDLLASTLLQEKEVRL